jgi:hypothetical protein
LFKTKLKTENDATGAEGDFTADCLKAHNEYREKHGVSPLKLNKKVCTLNTIMTVIRDFNTANCSAWMSKCLLLCARCTPQFLISNMQCSIWNCLVS